MTLIIAPLRAVERLVLDEKVGRVLTLLGPLTDAPSLALEKGAHVKLVFHDISAPEEGFLAPDRTHIASLVAFAEGWDRKAPFLIHCFAGISRSTAAAFIVMCALFPKRDARVFAQELRAHSPVASPNLRMVRFADDLLSRGGQMVSAIEEIGRGRDALEGPIVRWALSAAEG